MHSAPRDSLKASFEAMIALMESASPAKKAAVGKSLDALTSNFVQRYITAPNFRKTKAEEQRHYIETLAVTAAEEGMAMLIASELFRAWLGALSANDPELADVFLAKMAPFSAAVA